MTMCLTLVHKLKAVQPIPVAHWRAALAPHQPRRLERQQIWPPLRPVVVLLAVMAQLSQTAPPSPHHLQDGPCTEEAMTAKVPSRPPSPSLADSSLEVRQILRDQAVHALMCSEYQRKTNEAKQRATVLKQVASLDINQLPLPEPGKPLPGPSGESNGASHCVKGKQRDSTASSSDKEDPPPARKRKTQEPERH